MQLKTLCEIAQLGCFIFAELHSSKCLLLAVFFAELHSWEVLVLFQLERSGARTTAAFSWLWPVAPHLLDLLVTRPCPACRVIRLVVFWVSLPFHCATSAWWSTRVSTSSRLLTDLLLYNDWWPTVKVQYVDVSLHIDICVDNECCGLLILGTLGYVDGPTVAVVG